MKPTINTKRTQLPYYYHHRKKTNIPLAHQVVGKKCVLCGCILQLDDNNELVCADCGYVEENTVMTINYATMTHAPLFNTNGFTREEKQVIDTSRHFNNATSTRRIHYNFIISLVKHDLCLTSIDVLDIRNIIDKVPSLQKFHSKIPAETIIIGICRYVLKQRKVLGYLLRFNYKIYVEYNLTKHDYNIIEKNIKRYI